jgi:hypothetical protein
MENLNVVIHGNGLNNNGPACFNLTCSLLKDEAFCVFKNDKAAEQEKETKDTHIKCLCAITDKICMMTTRLACNRAIESSYWRMDNNSDVGLLTGYVLYRLPIELESMDLDTFSR